MKPDPDLEALIDTALAELREKMLKELSDGTASHGTLDQIEAVVTRLGGEFRRNLQRRLVTERTRGLRDNTVECACRARARYRETRVRFLTTCHGELAISRPYYYCSACRRGSVPLDAALGLDAGTTTRQVRLWMADLAARLPFAEATLTLERLTGVGVAATTLEFTAVAIGTALRHAQHHEAERHRRGRPPAAQRKPRRLYISVDGTSAPLREPWKRDGSAGPLICRGGECKTAILYEARSTPTGDQGVLHRTVVASLEDVTQFGPLVATLAHQAGHHFAPELVVLADGAAWIWNLAAAQFPTALQILDFFHASQHLFTVAHSCLGEGTPAAKEWVRERQHELKADRVEAVLEAITAFVPRGAEQRQLLLTEAGYFRNNAERMRYGTYLAKGYQIGSGVMEATCKHVVAQRVDQAGMHWSKETAEAVLALRGALLSTRPPDLTPYCSLLAA
jgi:hypothetical protein